MVSCQGAWCGISYQRVSCGTSCQWVPCGISHRTRRGRYGCVVVGDGIARTKSLRQPSFAAAVQCPLRCRATTSQNFLQYCYFSESYKRTEAHSTYTFTQQGFEVRIRYTIAHNMMTLVYGLVCTQAPRWRNSSSSSCPSYAKTATTVQRLRDFRAVYGCVSLGKPVSAASGGIQYSKHREKTMYPMLDRPSSGSGLEASGRCAQKLDLLVRKVWSSRTLTHHPTHQLDWSQVGGGARQSCPTRP